MTHINVVARRLIDCERRNKQLAARVWELEEEAATWKRSARSSASRLGKIRSKLQPKPRRWDDGLTSQEVLRRMMMHNRVVWYIDRIPNRDINV